MTILLGLWEAETVSVNLALEIEQYTVLKFLEAANVAQCKGFRLYLQHYRMQKAGRDKTQAKERKRNMIKRKKGRKNKENKGNKKES